MTLPPEVTGRKLDRNSAISLGLAIAMSAGAATFALRVPTEAAFKVIVNEALDPLEVQMHALDVRLTRIEERLKAKDGG